MKFPVKKDSLNVLNSLYYQLMRENTYELTYVLILFIYKESSLFLANAEQFVTS